MAGSLPHNPLAAIAHPSLLTTHPARTFHVSHTEDGLSFADFEDAEKRKSVPRVVRESGDQHTKFLATVMLFVPAKGKDEVRASITETDASFASRSSTSAEWHPLGLEFDLGDGISNTSHARATSEWIYDGGHGYGKLEVKIEKPGHLVHRHAELYAQRVVMLHTGPKSTMLEEKTKSGSTSVDLLKDAWKDVPVTFNHLDYLPDIEVLAMMEFVTRLRRTWNWGSTQG